MYTALSLVATATITLTNPLESSSTAMDPFTAVASSTVMNLNSVTTTDNLMDFTNTVFASTTSTASHFSTVIIPDNHITQHTPSGFSTTTPTVTTSSRSSSNTSTSFFIAIGVLTVLLIGSVIINIFCTALYIYRWRRYAKLVAS